MAVEPADYADSFKKGVKDLARSVTIPGFRAGMVPADVVRKKYGREVLGEELNKIVAEAFNKYIQENQLRFFAEPIPFKVKDQDFNPGVEQTYQFGFEIGLIPQFELKYPAGDAIEVDNITVDEKMLLEETDRVRSRYGKMSSPDFFNDEDVLEISLAEIDEAGKFKPDGFTKDVRFTARAVDNEEIRKQILSMQKGESIDVDLFTAFNDDKEKIIHHILNVDHGVGDALGRNFKLSLNNFMRLEKAELNQEFYDKIFGAGKVTDAAGFEEGMKKMLQDEFEKMSRAEFRVKLQKKMMELNHFDLPDDFLKHWINYSAENPMPPEELDHEYFHFNENLRWTLIKDSITHADKIEVTEEEMRNMAKAEIINYFGGYQPQGFDDNMLEDMTNRMLEKDKSKENYRDRILHDKVLTQLEAKATMQFSPISYEDYRHKHEHDHEHPHQH